MCKIRHATSDDRVAIVALQNSYIESGFVGLFREEPFRLDERTEWFAQFDPNGPYQLLVAYEDDRLHGYCASLVFRGGGVFRKTVETTLYTSMANGRRGVGTKLYSALFERLAKQDVRTAVSGIALPNDASVAIHRKFGYREVGTFEDYAFFRGQYVSSLWMQKHLGSASTSAN